MGREGTLSGACPLPHLPNSWQKGERGPHADKTLRTRESAAQFTDGKTEAQRGGEQPAGVKLGGYHVQQSLGL